MPDELGRYFEEAQGRIDEGLRAALGATEHGPASLAEAMRYALLAPGKRLRPLLVLLANEAAGGQPAQALAAACAVEMVHAYSLVHDDLPAMDNDDLRRGLPTCHKRFGEALAILAGDALLTLAFQVLAEGYPAATAAACCRELASAAGAAGMVGGQVEDLAYEHKAGDIEALDTLHGRKTGALIKASFRLGVLAAQGERTGGPDGAVLACLDGYGSCFGLAFQITDDLLDAQGDSGETGKRVGKDAARGKLTYPGLLGAAASRLRVLELRRQAVQYVESLGRAGDRLGQLFHWLVGRNC